MYGFDCSFNGGCSALPKGKLLTIGSSVWNVKGKTPKSLEDETVKVKIRRKNGLRMQGKA